MHPELERRVAALDTAERAVIATDLDGRIVYWNEEAERLYGWTAGETLGRSVIDVTPSDLTKPDAAEIMHVLHQGQPWSGEFLVCAKDGSRFTAHVTDIPVTDEAGNLVGIVGISRRVAYLRG